MCTVGSTSGKCVALREGEGESFSTANRVRPLKSRMGAVPIFLGVGEGPEVPAV